MLPGTRTFGNNLGLIGKNAYFLSASRDSLIAVNMVDGSVSRKRLEDKPIIFTINEKTRAAYAVIPDHELVQISLDSGVTNHLEEILLDDSEFKANAILSDGTFTVVALTKDAGTEDSHQINLYDSSSLEFLGGTKFPAPKLNNLTNPNPISRLGIRRIQGSNWLIAASQYLHLHVLAIDDSRLVFVKSYQLTSEWIFGFVFVANCIIAHGSENGQPWIKKLKLKI